MKDEAPADWGRSAEGCAVLLLYFSLPPSSLILVLVASLVAAGVLWALLAFSGKDGERGDGER